MTCPNNSTDCSARLPCMRCDQARRPKSNFEALMDADDADRKTRADYDNAVGDLLILLNDYRVKDLTQASVSFIIRAQIDCVRSLRAKLGMG